MIHSKKAENNESIFNLITFLKLKNIRDLTINHWFKASSLLPEEFKKVIYLSKEYSENQGAKFYFVYLPGYERYSNRFINKDTFKNYKNVIQILDEIDVKTIDLNKILFEIHPDPLSLFPFRLSGHYNKKGYELVAEKIINEIHKYENE